MIYGTLHIERLSWRHAERTVYIFSFPFVVSQKSVPCLIPAGRQIEIEIIYEFGLLCHRDEKLAAFSPDAIARVVDKS